MLRKAHLFAPKFNPTVMSQQRFQELIAVFTSKNEELKEYKREIKDAETDYPMELEELLMTLKDLKAQVKEQREDHIKLILEQDAAYGENRERVQLLKEEIAQAKLELFTLATNASREKGGLDTTVTVQGMPVRLQTQSEIQVYVDGKVIK